MEEEKRDLKIVMFRTGGDADAARQEVSRGTETCRWSMTKTRCWSRR